MEGDKSNAPHRRDAVKQIELNCNSNIAYHRKVVYYRYAQLHWKVELRFWAIRKKTIFNNRWIGLSQKLYVLAGKIFGDM